MTLWLVFAVPFWNVIRRGVPALHQDQGQAFACSSFRLCFLLLGFLYSRLARGRRWLWPVELGRCRL
jgi:hypothetical protein